MQKSIKRPLYIWPIIFLSFMLQPAVCQPVFAYAVPAWKIVQMAQEKNLPVSSLQVSRQTMLFERVFPDGKMEVREELYFHPTRGFRAEIKTQTGDKIYVTDGRSAIMVVNGKIVGEDVFDGTFLQLFLSRREKEENQQALRRIGIEDSSVSLGRMEGRVVIIIGAAPGDLSKPQIWVDKETLLPLRFIGTDYFYRNGAFVIQDLSDHFQADGAVWLPRVARSFMKSVLIRTSIVLRTQTNLSIPDAFFDIAHIRASYPYREQESTRNKIPVSPTSGASSADQPETEREPEVDVDKLFSDFQNIIKQP